MTRIHPRRQRQATADEQRNGGRKEHDPQTAQLNQRKNDDVAERGPRKHSVNGGETRDTQRRDRREDRIQSGNLYRAAVRNWHEQNHCADECDRQHAQDNSKPGPHWRLTSGSGFDTPLIVAL